LNIPRADATAVDRAVQRWAERGEGSAIFVEGEYRLFVGVFVVALLLDGDTVYVERLRRA